ncbi:KpsF/GutQ family sugar-phosphate isomerase [Catenovulum sp. 2E275]|uniref:KpsF/GutQ family sugar-phosphate isomerase n=1 Tax=Catenovulum sp. 2E275 TaxID=2980497 RepID=UPI0021CE411B|nr:KpsF/GutQ family sugar-phosphate isomerase [Catenovulum sp. 2E275]MCU4675465.1 KpsF/GutQ family sugar-phosphate isomerase [Catenovulum sp. 2E275]
MQNDSQAQSLINSAKQVIDIELEAIKTLYQSLDQNFTQACELLLNCRGKTVVTGIGKSGHVARKIAATLASTGSPAFFVHPAEACHGDLGMISKQDVVIALSNSGESSEFMTIVPVIKRIGAKMIALTSNPKSSLAELSDIHILVKADKEACPLGLAPTASTTAATVMGDALAIALLEAREFSADDFAFSHPLGNLGRKLLLKVKDLMHAGEFLPVVSENTPIAEALIEISQKSLGFVAIVNQQNTLTGIFTDGDLRRTLDKKINIHITPIYQVMTTGSVTIQPDMLAAEALKLMEDKKVNGFVVINELAQPVGAINIHDLLKAKVI